MLVEILPSAALTSEVTAALLVLWREAFGDRFTDQDAEHAFGGLHAILREGSTVLAQASAVPRTLLVDETPLLAGYVEAVATLPQRQGAGFGSAVMRALQEAMNDRFDLGFLSTGRARAFYERLGWESWQGRSYVLRGGGRVRTAEEDAGLMVLRLVRSGGIRLDSEITCEDRAGDCW